MKPKREAIRLALAIVLLMLAPAAARAKDANEFWPELQVHYWFGDHRSRAIAMASLSRIRDSDVTYQADQGLTFEHQFSSYFLGRIGDRHANSTEGGAFTENRLLAEQTFRLHLPSKVIAECRTREDFRRPNSGFSIRLRERMQFQRDVTIDHYTFTPYASAEVFTRFLSSTSHRACRQARSVWLQ